MGEKDLAEKQFFENNDIFADIFNYALHDGKQIIRPEDLIDQPTESFFEKDGKIHNQLRDVAKLWKHNGKIIAFFGLELQSTKDDHLINRILSYEGTSYKRLDMENQHHIFCFTIVLYFGMDKPWPKDCISYHDYFQLDDVLKNVRAFREIPVISMAFLDANQRQKFQKHLRILSEFLYKIRRKEDYTEIREDSRYITQIFEVLRALSPDREDWDKFTAIYEERKDKNMITEPVIPNILRDTFERGKKEQNVAHITNMIMHGMPNGDILAIIPDSTTEQIETIRERINDQKNLN